MKKTLLFLLIAGMISVSSLYASEYYLYGEVFDASGSSGTAATANSFGMLQAYRLGIAGQIGLQNENPGNQIYAANGTLPAYYDTDVGDAQWTTPPAVGQIAILVIEVFSPLFGWTGDSYVACTETVISSDDVNINQETDFSNLGLKVIPTPAIISQGANQITIGFTGIDMDLIQSYTLYRGTTPTFTTATATAVAVIPQNRNNAIQYTDNTGLVYGTTYYYKILVDFTWGGGGGAPAYYETNATSAASSPAVMATYTPSATATLFISETPTYTATGTPTMTQTTFLSDTPTFTLTMTATLFLSETQTCTATGTPTYTVTMTYTNTPVNTATDTPVNTATNTPIDTATDTYTVTATDTVTSTITQTTTITLTSTITSTFTATPLVTDTPTPPVTSGSIAYPQPAANTITFAYNLPTPSSVKIYVYNLIGVEVAVFEGAPGNNPATVTCDISKFAPGMYFYIIKAPDIGVKFAVNKFEVEK